MVIFVALCFVLRAMSDERVRFIIDNVYALCRLQTRDALSELQGQAGSSKAVSEFLEDPRYLYINSSRNVTSNVKSCCV